MPNGTIHRVTGETDVRMRLNLDGTGRCQASTGVLFLNHMLHQISSHGLLDLEISATGDTHIDDHHPHEDVVIAIGHCVGPLDEGKRRSPLRPAG
jgi:imidazoleglycerol-phosphate dehydratase